MAAEKYRKEEKKKKRVRATPRLLLLSTFSFTVSKKQEKHRRPIFGIFFFFLHKISFKTFFFDTHPVKIKKICRINVFDLNHMLQ